MIEANQSYQVHLDQNSRAQYARAVVVIARFETRKEIKRKIKKDGRGKAFPGVSPRD